MVGSISVLGLGSGLELQSMLEQLRAVDQTVIDNKKTKVADTRVQLDEFTVVKNKLLTMKSKALNLSLSSTFLSRTASSSLESVLTAKAGDGTIVQSTSLKVTSVAANSSFESSAGFATDDTSIYVPTAQESTTGVTDPAVDVAAVNGETMTIKYGAGKTIAVTAASDLTMNQLVDEINNHADNQGGPGANGRYVTAETYASGGKSYIRIKSDTSNGTGETNRVAVTETLSSLNFAPPSSMLSYKVGVADAVSISVAADTTLSELVDLINNDSDNAGVTASVINKGDGATPYRLVLRSDATGEDNRITILANPGDVPFTEKQGASGVSLNAKIEIDGITYERKSNTVTDLMQGVTLTLLGTGSSTVAVADDPTTTIDLIKGLVEAYNDAVHEVKTKSGYDEATKKFGVLSRTTLNDLPFTLESAMTSVVQTGSNKSVTSLFDLGLVFNRDGSITIDETVLNQTVKDHGSEVKSFFLGDATQEITGFADLVNDQLRELTSVTGQIDAEKSSAETRIKDMEAQINLETERLDKKYATMAKQFSELDRYMKQMTSISSYLTGQFKSLTDTGSSSGGSL
ncbi:MAG: hypothetical protein A2511_17810 [Deltaproteobacteria bacterium RIFOXYD12_FULL_50_9]|nr:MAG: hypothetical protein A2511_17810 [Deltaproteobacteria bacterium RIFOXYD12_FULL_50_9]